MAGTLTIGTLSDGTNSTSATNCISGSAKAWVNFNGTTSPGTILAAYNISSITKNATGDLNVNFTNAMSDANYAFVVGSVGLQAGGANQITSLYGSAGGGATTKTTTQFRIVTGYGSANTGIDNANASIVIFR